MSMIDTINPWGKARRADSEMQQLNLKLRQAEQDAAAEKARADRFALLAVARANEISRMQKLMKDAHYRNPKTGVIGKRGVFPERENRA